MKDSEEIRLQKIEDIWRIIVRLRGDTGCPWDRKQTPQTVQTYLVEEAHEAASAIREQKVADAAEELGDVLFMVLFLVHMYEQQGDFSFADVCDRVSEKMIGRHPHVFGETSVNTAEEVKDNWEKIKAREKDKAGRQAEPVPESLPALMRAYRMVSRLAHKKGGEWNDLETRLRDFSKRAGDLERVLASGKDMPADLLGSLLLDLVVLARIKGLRPEDSLHEVLRAKVPE
ncbi:MAG: MazG family protein [Syntrophobacteraceae bacterium]